MKGLFISIDGIDGTGKSTNMGFIKQSLEQHNYAVVTTHEPGGTTIGEAIRNILLNNNHQIHALSELLLLYASRQELITKVIIPNLNQGICVISDRYFDASVAYQGYARGLGKELVESMNKYLNPFIIPDLTFIFDAPIATTIKRRGGSQKDRIEQEPEEFFVRVQQGYREIAAANPLRVKLINTDCSITKVQTEISKYLNELINVTLNKI
jgi:dTMP kinase